MNFSSLVLMEKEKDSNYFIKELGSYEVNDGAEYIIKMYFDGEKVNIYFDTNKDVEEWEYSAIFDLFEENSFAEKGYDIEEIDDEYNPTWRLKFEYLEDHSEMQRKLIELCNLIEGKMINVFENIKDKKALYE